MSNKHTIAIAAIAALLVLIIVLQNTEAVNTKLLFVTVAMPRAALLFGTMIVGFVLGMITCSWMTRTKRKVGN